MTKEQIDLVKQTSGVLLSSALFADRFYARLFEIAPETRALFRSDLGEQKIKFMNMLATLIGALNHPDVFRTIPRHLGSRHAEYGVTADHYAPVGTALLEVLESEIGPGFTPEVKAAWTALYTDISASMIGGPGKPQAAA